jgi:hypothetical protein
MRTFKMGGFRHIPPRWVKVAIRWVEERRGTLAEGTPLPAAGNPANLKAFVRGERSTSKAFSLGVEES